MGSEWHEISTGKMDLLVGSFSRDRVWDEETINNLAEQAGVDPKDFAKVDAKQLDEKLAMAFLKDLLNIFPRLKPEDFRRP